jgi:hypothetical protein
LPRLAAELRVASIVGGHALAQAQLARFTHALHGAVVESEGCRAFGLCVVSIIDEDYLNFSLIKL